jgi:hypothetical protein
VQQGVLGQGDHAVEIDVAGLAPGVYLVRANAGNASMTHRLVVTR